MKKTTKQRDQRLYDLIEDERYQAAITWLNPDRRDNCELMKLIGSRDLSPLMAVIQKGYIEENESALALCFLLIQIGGKDFLKRSTNEGTALHYAFSNGPYVKLAHRMIEVGGKELVMIRNNSDGRTALHFICSSHYAYTEERGDTSNDNDRDGMSDTNERNCWVDVSPKDELVQQLLNVGGEDLAFTVDRDGQTALHLLSEHYSHYFQPDILDRLLEVEGEKMTLMKDRDGETALHLACKSWRHEFEPQLVRKLIKSGGERLTLLANFHGQTALHAAMSTNRDHVNDLLGVGGEKILFAVDNDGKTALHYAINYGGEQVRHLLNFGGAKLALVADRDGYTALHEVCNNRSSGIAEEMRHLLEVGGEKLVLSRDRRARTALHIGCLWMGKNHPDIFRQLLEVGGERLLFSRDELGRTLLHCACIDEDYLEYLCPKINEQLLKTGGEQLVSITDNEGMTALHYACEFSYIEREESSSEEDSESDDSEVTTVTSADSEGASTTSNSIEPSVPSSESVISRGDSNTRNIELRQLRGDDGTNRESSDRFILDTDRGQAQSDPLNIQSEMIATNMPSITSLENDSNFASIPSSAEGDDSLATRVDEEAASSKSRQIETIYQLLEVGRKDLLLIKDTLADRTAFSIYVSENDSSQDVIDRFIEIGGPEISL